MTEHCGVDRVCRQCIESQRKTSNQGICCGYLMMFGVSGIPKVGAIEPARSDFTHSSPRQQDMVHSFPILIKFCCFEKHSFPISERYMACKVRLIIQLNACIPVATFILVSNIAFRSPGYCCSKFCTLVVTTLEIKLQIEYMSTPQSQY